MEQIKDNNFRIIGFYDDMGSKIALRDKEYKILGFYDKKTDRTLDKDFKFVGNGNQLLRLLR